MSIRLLAVSKKGDFKKTIAQSLGVNPGGKDPILLVVKKNKSILNNLNLLDHLI